VKSKHDSRSSATLCLRIPSNLELTEDQVEHHGKCIGRFLLRLSAITKRKFQFEVLEYGPQSVVLFMDILRTTIDMDVDLSTRLVAFMPLQHPSVVVEVLFSLSPRYKSQQTKWWSAVLYNSPIASTSTFIKQFHKYQGDLSSLTNSIQILQHDLLVAAASTKNLRMIMFFFTWYGHKSVSQTVFTNILRTRDAVFVQNCLSAILHSLTGISSWNVQTIQRYRQQWSIPLNIQDFVVYLDMMPTEWLAFILHLTHIPASQTQQLIESILRCPSKRNVLLPLVLNIVDPARQGKLWPVWSVFESFAASPAETKNMDEGLLALARQYRMLVLKYHARGRVNLPENILRALQSVNRIE
jgi:hypothetical protein